MSLQLREPETGANFDVFSGDGKRATMRDVETIMNKLRTRSGKNPSVLGLRLRQQMIASQNGYPKFMYHDRLEPVYVIKEDEDLERELMQLGYSDTYTFREYPKTLYRRNTDPRFAAKTDPATGAQIDFSQPQFVEAHTVANEQAHKELLKQKAPKHCGPWLDSVAKIDPLPDGPDEDPAVTIARLEGEIDGLLKSEQQKDA